MDHTEKEKIEIEHREESDVGYVDVATGGAFAAENAEHSMTVLEAARAYPMACFWAFIMSFCIVSMLLYRHMGH